MHDLCFAWCLMMPDAWCSMLPRGRRLTVMRGFPCPCKDLTFLSNVGGPCPWRDLTSHHNAGDPRSSHFRQSTLREHWASQHCWWWWHLPRSVLGLRESLHGQAMGAVEDGVLDKDLKRGTKMSYIDTRSEAKRYSGFNDQIGFRRFALFWINWTLF